VSEHREQTPAPARGLAGEVARSLARARLEAERHILERGRRAALQDLGERAYALAVAGRLGRAALDPELFVLEMVVSDLEAKDTAIVALAAQSRPALPSHAGAQGARLP
jgi:hypothetical protein